MGGRNEISFRIFMNKAYSLLRAISLISYCFIILNGWMIGLPFIVVLFFSLFEFGSLAQLTAIMSFTGFILLIYPFQFKSLKALIILQSSIYFLLLSPIVVRLISVPLHLFKYSSFLIPVLLFVLLFPLSTIFMYKSKKLISNNSDL